MAGRAAASGLQHARGNLGLNRADQFNRLGCRFRIHPAAALFLPSIADVRGAAAETENLKNNEASQQREDADDDDNAAHDLFNAALNRKHVDEVEHENDDDEGDERVNEYIHANSFRSWPF